MSYARIIRTCLCLLVCAALSGSVFALELLRYNTANNSKAKGLNLTVKYPTGWIAKDGERPNIVQKFVKSTSGITELLMLQVNNIPPEALSEIHSLTENDFRDIYASMGENTSVQSVRRTKIENQIAYIGDLTYTVERAGMKIYQSVEGMTLIYKDKMIILTCGVGGVPQQKQYIDTKQLSNRTSLCQSYFNSLVILDQYK
jgi:hypothetical protein